MKLRTWLHIFASLVLFVGVSHAQTPEPTPTTVTISREAAVKCLENADKLAAIEAESAAKDKAIADLKAIIADIKIELAKLSGEKTQLETTLVRYNALIDILIKNARPKKVGLINLF